MWPFTGEEKQGIVIRVDSTLGGGAAECRAVEVGKEYLSLFLQSVRLTAGRASAVKIYPAVYSDVSVARSSGERVSFRTLRSAQQNSAFAAVDGRNLDKVVCGPHRLVGPIPFRGGDVDVSVGLVSVGALDGLAMPFLQLLQSMGEAAGVAYFGRAMPFVEPMRQGLELLTKAHSGLRLELGCSGLLKPVRTGHMVVLGAKVSNPKRLRVDADGRLCSVDMAMPQGPHLVLQCEATRQRDDWFLIPDVVTIHQELLEAVRKGRFGETEELLRVFKRTVMTSPDLFSQDGQRLWEEVEAEAKGVMGSSPMAGRRAGRKATPVMRELRDIDLWPKGRLAK